MSKKRIYVATLLAFICVVAFASELIRVNPEFRSWTIESSDKGVSTGVWESTPGKWKFTNSHWEYCRIISGVSVVTEVTGESYTVKAGDSFVLKPGF